MHKIISERKKIMRKKYLLTLPIVALLASCNAKSATPSAPSAKSQALNSDETVVTSEEEDYGEHFEHLKSVFNLEHDALNFHLDLDASVSAKGKAEDKTTINELIDVKGAIDLGYTTNFISPVRGSSSSYPIFRLAVSDLSANIKGLGEFEIPPIEGLDLEIYIRDEEEASYVYADFSDHELQDLLYTVLTNLIDDPKTEEVNEAEGLLNVILGSELDEDGYRPGLCMLNLSAILNELNEQSKESEEDIGKYAYFIEDTVKTVISLGLSLLNEFYENNVKDTPMALIAPFFAELGGKVGVVRNEADEIVRRSFVINSSLEKVENKIYELNEVEDEDSGRLSDNIKANFGLLVSVGTENGSTAEALQEFKASVGILTTIENVTTRAQADLDLNAYYNTLAQFQLPDRAFSSNDLTGFVLMFLQAR